LINIHGFIVILETMITYLNITRSNMLAFVIEILGVQKFPALLCIR